MKRFSREQFEVTYYLGAQVGQAIPFMKEIACMPVEWREIIALLDILKIVKPDDKALQTDIEKILKPICERIGWANWNPDIITHLAMRLGDVSEEYDAE
jgi:hypothetical protein